VWQSLPLGMLLDFAFKRSRLMIPNQLAEGRLVKRVQHVGEFAILVAMTLIKSRLFHGVSPVGIYQRCAGAGILRKGHRLGRRPL
jgi:hypothetical protein